MHRARISYLGAPHHLTITNANQNDVTHFSILMKLSAPSLFLMLFGNEFEATLKKLFIEPQNLFSFQHVYFTEIDGNKVGMLLGYDWQTKKRAVFRTGWLIMKYLGANFIKKMPYFLKFKNIIGQIYEDEYYISNVAVYPEYRGKNIGTFLINRVEVEAKEKDIKRIGLDVESANIRAISLYKRLGFTTAKQSSVKLGGQLFSFYRMSKELK